MAVAMMIFTVKMRNDYLTGGLGNDRLYGRYRDIIYGNEGIDRLYGDVGMDKLYGGDGNDYLFGQDGDDILHGDGADRIVGDSGNDTIYGGDDKTKFTLAQAMTPPTVKAMIGLLDAGNDFWRCQDYSYGNDDTDTLHGGIGNDFTVGSAMTA